MLADAAGQPDRPPCDWDTYAGLKGQGAVSWRGFARIARRDFAQSGINNLVQQSCRQGVRRRKKYSTFRSLEPGAICQQKWDNKARMRINPKVPRKGRIAQTHFALWPCGAKPRHCIADTLHGTRQMRARCHARPAGSPADLRAGRRGIHRPRRSPCYSAAFI